LSLNGQKPSKLNMEILENIQDLSGVALSAEVFVFSFSDETASALPAMEARALMASWAQGDSLHLDSFDFSGVDYSGYATQTLADNAKSSAGNPIVTSLPADIGQSGLQHIAVVETDSRTVSHEPSSFEPAGAVLAALQVGVIHETIIENAPAASVSSNADAVQVSDVSHSEFFTSADAGADASIAASAPSAHLNTTQAGAQITRGNYHWGSTLGASPGAITFGFRTSAPGYNESGENLPGTFTPFTAQEQATTRAALALWASVANITFTDLGNSNSATIEFANYYSSTDNSQAFAYYPGSTAASAYQGDVFMNTAYVNTTNLGPGTYDWLTLIHEIGHALGLQHPGDYNAGPGQTITYNNSALYVEDTRQYSLMSYFDESSTGANFGGVYNETPMLDDIAAIQRLYGANTSTFSGNTVFGFNSNAGTPYSITSSSQKVAYTVYDTGGNDTLDFSGYTQTQTINLNAESFSSVGGGTYNVSIAQNVTIENAIGGSGADTIIGNAANNTIRGGAGVDTLTGGGGIDTFIFTSGTSSATAGQHDRITDFVSGTDKIDLSGMDAVPSTSGIVDLFNFLATAAFSGVAGVLNYFYDGARGVTVVQGDTNGDRAADFAIDLTGNLSLAYTDFIGVNAPTVVIETNGSTKLTQVGNLFYLYNAGGTGPLLKLGGVEFYAGQNGGWLPISAEAISGGYEVAFKLTGQDQYAVWRTDTNGNYNGQITGGVAGSNYVLETLEPSFSQDINSDGTIGNVLATTVVETRGATTLINAGNHFYLLASGLGPTLKLGGADFIAGQNGGWLPIAAEAISGGYEVAFKLTGNDQYSVWKTDADGNYNGQLTGAVTGSSNTLQSLETSFNQDLNGDGTIGLVMSAVESRGSIILAESGGHYYLGTSGPSLKSGGADFVAGQNGGWLPIGVEAISGGYEVAWKLSGGDQYSVWKTDANGNYSGQLSGALTGGSATLESFETSFNQDLNGDGTIGLVVNTVESSGSVTLAESGGHYYLGTSGPSLKSGGADFVAGQNGGWLPIGVEAISGGYEVAWKLSGGDQYSVWKTDTNGNYSGQLSGALTGGSGTLQSFETSFNQDLNGDGTIGLVTAVVESSGSTNLNQLGGNYYLLTSGTGPSLKLGGVDFVAGQNGGWLPIGVEAISGGYEVAWKLSGSDQYAVWKTDTTGNYNGQLTGGVSGSNYVLQTLETSFHQDLNGDGTTGNLLSTSTIESSGSTTLVNAGNHFYLLAANGLGPSLKLGGTDVVAGQLGSWLPIAAEATSGGYQVAWKLTGSDQYSVWGTDSDGNYNSQVLGAVSGSNVSLKMLEASFHQDLNGDGTVSSQLINNSSGGGVVTLAGNQDSFVFAQSGGAVTVMHSESIWQLDDASLPAQLSVAGHASSLGLIEPVDDIVPVAVQYHLEGLFIA
jgi:serralysin